MVVRTSSAGKERDIWGWFHWDQNNRFGNVSEWTDVLRSHD